MSNAAKRKGSEAEAAVRDVLRGAGWGVERVPAGVAQDRGDLAGVPGWTFEIKSYTDVARAVREGVDELDVERENAGTPYGAAIVKRPRRTDPLHWYFVMPLGEAMPIVRLTSGLYVMDRSA